MLKSDYYSKILIFLIFIFFIYNNLDKRKQYENFLLKEYKNIPNYTKEDLNHIPKPEHPDLATYQNYFMSVDPELGYVPLERLKEALRYTQSRSKNTRNITWTNTVSSMGGRTRCIAFDPSDQTRSKVWAGGVTGGLWYNLNISDENSSWIPVNDLWDNLVVSSIAFDPNNSNIMYVGTGEANTAIVTYRESSGRGIGIWKSIDSGLSWNLLSSTEDFTYITDIEIDIESNLYIGVVSGIYYGLQESLPTDGLYKSTDEGLSWIQVLPNIGDDSSPYPVSDIEINDNGRIFVGTMKNINGNGGSTLLYSDTGNLNDWYINNDVKNIILEQEEFNIPGRVVLSSSISNPNYVYAVFGSGFINEYGFNYSYGNHILKSTNNGNTWNFINVPDNYDNHNWATLAWHALEIAIDPINENIIYLGGLDLHKSNDGGVNWNKLSDWSLMYQGGGDLYVHADIHSIKFRSDNPNEFVITSDGGIFYTSNGESENIIFNEHNKDYNTLQYYTGDIYPIVDTETFIGGLQDNGTLIYSDLGIYDYPSSTLTTNNMISGGDGAYCFWDKNQPEILITSTYYNRYYLFVDGEYINYFNGNNGIFINPSDYDFNSNTLFANAVRFDGSLQNRLYTISNIDNDANEQNINLNTNTLVPFSCIKYSKYSQEFPTLFVGTQSGYLYKITYTSQNNFYVSEITGDLFPNGNISSISLGDNDNVIMVTFSNYGVSSIWTTMNGGVEWTERESNLPDMPIRSSIFHPQSNENVLIATEIGVWGTSNLMSDNVIWNPYNSNLANVRVDMLNIRESDNMVLASTHGRGQFYGTYNLNEFFLGDINIDQNIDVLDIVLLVNNVIYSEEFIQSGDLNTDNLINILDVVLLVNLILND